MSRRPKYPPELSEEEVARMEAVRAGMRRTVLPLLGMARFVASKFPAEAVEAKVTGDWLLERGKTKFPELVRVVESRGEEGRRWLQRQVKEIVGYLTGGLVWDPKKLRMVRVVAKKA